MACKRECNYVMRMRFMRCFPYCIDSLARFRCECFGSFTLKNRIYSMNLRICLNKHWTATWSIHVHVQVQCTCTCTGVSIMNETAYPKRFPGEQKLWEAYFQNFDKQTRSLQNELGWSLDESFSLSFVRVVANGVEMKCRCWSRVKQSVARCN